MADLFSIQPGDDASRGYLNLYRSDTEELRAIREHCEHLWTLFAPYADPQFLTQFVLHFHERWFEMYLGTFLLGAGVRLVHTEPPGPDLLCEINGSRCWIEAICPTAGEPGRPDTIVRGDGITPWNLITLRIRGAVEEKKRKYDRYIEQGIVAKEDRLLIAVNVSAVPYAREDAERYVFRALYGLGELVMTFDLATMRLVDRTNRQIATIEKLRTGAPVGVQPFIDGSMPPVAAAIISGDVSASAALSGGTLPDLTLYPNLTAAAPWHAGALPFPHEWTFEVNADGWNGRRQDTP